MKLREGSSHNNDQTYLYDNGTVHGIVRYSPLELENSIEERWEFSGFPLKLIPEIAERLMQMRGVL
jgi:hypothetical protein